MSGVRRRLALPEVEILLREGVVAELPDRDLLERFVSDRDRSGELAFTILVARHGPMVLGVCRRILRDANEVDDAFQATFLVLARKAGSIRLAGSLGPWLQGVSRRVARRLQDDLSRGRAKLGHGDRLESIPDRRPMARGDIVTRLEVLEVVEGLPAPFRTAIQLCYLEGLSHEEAATRLGCPVGTVRSRLARGRALLRQRLEAGEVGPRGEPDANMVRAGAGPSLPTLAPWLLESTAQAAVRLAAGQPVAGVVPARVANLVTGVLWSMSSIKMIASWLVAMASLVGWVAWAGQTAPQAGGGRREIDQPPSDWLRGDFDKRVPVRRKVLSDKSEARKVADLPEDFPAFVVETVPRLGDVEVDPETTKEIRVTFSKPMMDKSWSWTHGNVYASPETTGDIHYLPDKRTCVMPVKLEPGKTYVIGINGGRFENFRDAKGRPSMAMTLAFRTRTAK